jgi:hypothetical protein
MGLCADASPFLIVIIDDSLYAGLSFFFESINVHLGIELPM